MQTRNDNRIRQAGSIFELTYCIRYVIRVPRCVRGRSIYCISLACSQQDFEPRILIRETLHDP